MVTQAQRWHISNSTFNIIISQKNQIWKKKSVTPSCSHTLPFCELWLSCRVCADIFWIFFHSSEFSCIFQLSGDCRFDLDHIIISTRTPWFCSNTHTKISPLKSVEKTSIANDTMFKGYTMNGNWRGSRNEQEISTKWWFGGKVGCSDFVKFSKNVMILFKTFENGV